MRILSIILFCFSISSCSFEESKQLRKSDLFDDFIAMTKKVKQTSGIKEDGLYFSKYQDYTVDGTLVKYDWYSPLLFKKNGFVYPFNKFIINDTVSYNNTIRQKELFDFKWGIYEVEGKTIRALIPTEFYKRGLVSDYRLCRYEGRLIGSDSITNWRMIPPFPTNIDYEMNKDVIQHKREPLSFSFYKNDLALQVDTAGAWFNKILTK